jgi:colicin import membrane protein
MSTVTRSPTPPPRFPDESHPFFYGWRDVLVRRPDGTEDIDQIPLTAEDVLHPEDGDHVVHSTAHNNDLNYLASVFRALLANDPHALVLSDCGVDWHLPGEKDVSPDIAVVFGVKQQRGDWPMFDVDAEYTRPALVIEVTSPSTRSGDFGKKVGYYHRAGVPTYIIADARESPSGRRLELIEYRYAAKRYERIAPNAGGRIRLEALNVWLGITLYRTTGTDRLACFDPDTNEEIGDYTAVRQAHANELEARLRAEAQTAEALAQAAAEAQARIAAEARIRELEALLKRSAPDS